MYYPELMDISKEYSLRPESLVKFDSWLGKRDWSQRRGLRASHYVRDTQANPSEAQILMIYATEKNILSKQYVYFCPYCTEFQRYNDISQIELEKICHNNGETYTLKTNLHNILVVFDIIKKPIEQSVIKT